MPSGKLASQAGHAYLNSFLDSIKKDSSIAKQYHEDGIGTKVCLGANLDDLLKIEEQLLADNIPHSLIVDSGHIMPPFFDGSPIITALGIGPVYHNTAFPIIGRLGLV
tara:strand:+ start:17684 stop:18007 length:324 start_codon:yes stop_codon:yes gene_type:complete